MSLASVRDLRPELRLATPEELAPFEHDLLSEFVLARVSVGISDGTVVGDVGVIVAARSRFTRPLMVMEPRDLDWLFGRHQQGMAHATKIHKAHPLSVYFEFLELRHQPAIHRDGRSNSAPLKARSASNSAEAKPLSEIISSPGRFVTLSGSRPGIAASTSRSSIFGFARAHRIGRPVGVHTRNRLRPQKNRLWLAQYPYPVHPAMSDHFTVGRERPHSTGVASTIQWLWNQKSVSTASSRIPS